jgi:hypothetical protein
MFRCRLHVVVTVAALVAAVSGRVAARRPPPPAPSPADALFDDTVVHEIRLAINSKTGRRSDRLPRANTYYPTDLRWRDQVVRNIGIRSRGTGSRSGVKPGLPSTSIDTPRDRRFWD